MNILTDEQLFEGIEAVKSRMLRLRQGEKLDLQATNMLIILTDECKKRKL